MTAPVAALYVRADCAYRGLGVDVWPEERDARRFPGGAAVVAHPPCRGWGRYRHRAKIAPGELDLARLAVWQVRASGGVLEHPAHSTLWRDMSLPRPGCARDVFGGWTLAVYQFHWGHRALKPTWLYIVGVAGVAALPDMPVRAGMPETTIERMCKRQREMTPPKLAEWLVKLAERAGARR